MKRFYLIAILITICGITAMAQNSPGLAHQTTGKDRIKYFIEMPSIDYDEDNQEIIVQGAADYYMATITSQTTQMIVLETVVGGDYDIIDVSMLMAGTYNIDLVSSNGNFYSWTFTQGVGLTNRTTGRSTGFVGTDKKINKRE